MADNPPHVDPRGEIMRYANSVASAYFDGHLFFLTFTLHNPVPGQIPSPGMPLQQEVVARMALSRAAAKVLARGILRALEGKAASTKPQH